MGKLRSTRVTSTHLVLVVVVSAIVCAVIGIVVWFAKPTPECGGDRSGIGGDDSGKNGSDFAPGTEPWLNLRLPAYTVPRHYDVALFPDFYDGRSTFSGQVSVDVDVKMNTHYLLIHYKQMTIDSVATRVEDIANASASYKVVDQFAHDANQFWVVKTQPYIPEGSRVRLTLRFNGSLTNGIVGLYKSSYVNSVTNETRYLATSKFEPVDARKAFPCFDEPNLKATFSIQLKHRNEYLALSNMPVKSVNSSGQYKETTFETSVLMSTYLVCFIVCDFDYKEQFFNSGDRRLPFRVYATPDKKDQIDYALYVGVNVTSYYEEYFGLEYPLPKQDMIAIPDFVSGAMEHWGLITYRETNLLYLEGQSSAVNKQRVASVIAHELAHQWFGNIVTMDWWDDLWLNEGFASYMEYVGVDHIEQPWNMYGQILVDDVFPVMVTDSKLSSHPIVVDVKRPEQITEVFDSISYSKGAAVIFMLQAVLGEAVFKDGLKDYLNKYRYGNARTDDLWNSLTTATRGKLDVKAMMDTWTRQMGFPVVNLKYDDSNNLFAEQVRFLEDAQLPIPKDSLFEYKWKVPLSYVLSNGTEGLVWMPSADQRVAVPFKLNNDDRLWVKFNRGSTGFYRVNYPADLWNRLSNAMQNMSVEDRAGLINDALNLARSGYLNYSLALSFARSLKNETEYVPWLTAISALNFVSRALETRSDVRSYWQCYIRSLLATVWTPDVWPRANRTHLAELLSESIIRLACGNELPDCLSSVHQYFNSYLQKTEVPPGIRRVVYFFAMKNSTENEWNFMWNDYMKTSFPQERVNLLYGLAQTRNLTLIERYLDYCWNETLIRDQDFFTVVTYMGSNLEANPTVWRWVRDQWPNLVKRFQIENRNLGRLVPDIVSGFSTEQQLKEVEEFFAQYPDAGAGARGRATALETIRGNIAWSTKYVGDIKTALSTILASDVQCSM